MIAELLQRPFLVLDFVGVAVFAITGALAAARLRHDVITAAAFAILTGMGGGTLRDLLIGAPVFWMNAGGYLWTCLIAALGVWLVGERPWRGSALIWLDAVGLAAYAVVGAAKALNADVSAIAAVLMGVLTATFGGIMRDLFAGEPSVLLKREIYISAAILSAAAYVGAREFAIDPTIAGSVAFALGFGLRAGALRFGWTLPGFDSGKSGDAK